MTEQELPERATKAEAAEYLGVSEKAIERYAGADPPKLSKVVEKKPGGGFINYYDRKELIKLKKQMDTPTPRQSDTQTAIARRAPSTPRPQETARLFEEILTRNEAPKSRLWKRPDGVWKKR